MLRDAARKELSGTQRGGTANGELSVWPACGGGGVARLQGYSNLRARASASKKRHG